MKAALSLGKYRHYKGGLYEVISIATHSETLEEMVIYRSLTESADFKIGSLWVRPLSMFLETVEVDGKLLQRFERC
jgi:hypothetical protein